MNLMFRKNFREGGSGGSKPSGAKLNKMNRTGKRSRDMSYSGPASDESFTQYRTHLFFNANRNPYQDGDNGGDDAVWSLVVVESVVASLYLRTICKKRNVAVFRQLKIIFTNKEEESAENENKCHEIY